MVSARRPLINEGRSNNFDAARVALALAVIFSHSYPILLGSNDDEPIHRFTGGQRTAGELAVDGFFLISGFLIAASWQRSRGTFDYLRRRVLRIYPGFLVAVAFSSLVVAPGLVADRAAFWRAFDVRRFAFEAFNLNGAYAPDLITNGSLWSIRYEFCCYLAIAAMGLVGMFRRRWSVVVATLGCLAIHAGQLIGKFEMPGSRLSWLWCYPGFWPRLASCFLAGACFQLYGKRIASSAGLALAAAVGLAIAARFPASKTLPLLIPPLGGYVLFYLAFLPMGRLKDVAHRGDFSYGLYLYAFPVQRLLAHWFGGSLNTWGLTASATLVTLVLAVVSWFGVERPFLRLKKIKTPAWQAETPLARQPLEPRSIS